MASKSYFAHTSPEGLTPWHWLDLVGYDYEYAGENLAINFTDSQDVTSAWMNSPTHRANIAKAQYSEVGTGIATGTYQGYETIFVAQVYAKPAAKAAAQTVQTAPAASEQIDPVGDITALPGPATASIEAPEAQVLGSETDTAVAPVKAEKASSLWQRLASAPRHTMNYFLYAIGAIVAAAVLIKLAVSMKAHHVDLVANGLCVIAIVFGVYLANSFLSQRNAGLAPAATFEAFDALDNARAGQN
jgi:hypothetical protein